jgi:hypothetical protein
MSANTGGPTAAATRLTGRYRRRGQAAAALRLWAEQAGVNLVLVDDAGSAATASRAYAEWIGTTDLLIGPYAGGLVGRSARSSATPGSCFGIMAAQPTTWLSR